MSDSILLLLCMGFLGGVLFATIFIGLLVSYSQEPLDGDRGDDNCVSCGSRHRCSYYRHHK